MFPCRRGTDKSVMTLVRFIQVFCLLALCITLLTGCQTESAKVENNQLNEARRAYVEGAYYHAETLLEKYLDESGDPIGRKEAWNRLYDIVVTVRGDTSRGLRILRAMRLEFAEDKALVADAHYRAGELHARMGESEQAIQEWEDFLKLMDNPKTERGDVMLRLARLYAGMERYDDAQSWLSRCIEQSPNPEEVFICRLEQGHTAFLMGNNDEALEFFSSLAHDLDQQHSLRPATIFALAQVYERMDKRTQAVELYDSILTTHPNPKAVRLRLEYLQTKQATKTKK
ncbi:tetratricopeptide repeat protein [Desulfovibrio inopinatus]|uniref:tetratricopeptide repeat protein n=1 Tax=Desulfovibrio inopinatus TaxID=102109 RepID=UPI00041513C9|nr:tetratricopeptide repeat protein [Desulfovibrio inopinatus]